MGVIEENEDKLETQLTAINQVVEKASMRVFPYYMRQRQALDTVLPIGGRYVDMMRALFTSSAAAFVPFNVVEMQMMDQPFYYGINQVSKEPIWANRKKLMNGNGFVFAVPGGGKSFTGAKIILDLEQTLNVRVAAESGWDGFALSCFRLLLPERHPIL